MGLSRYFLIVSRSRPGLFDYLSRQFSGDDRVQIVADRRREERRHRLETHDPERRSIDRRRQPSREERLRYEEHGLSIVRRLQEAHARLSTLVERLPSGPGDVARQPQKGETRIVEPREQAVKWIEEGHHLLGILAQLLQESEQLRVQVETAEHICEQLAQAIGRLQVENEDLRKERAEMGDTLKKLIREVLEPMAEKLEKVPPPPRRSPFRSSL